MKNLKNTNYNNLQVFKEYNYYTKDVYDKYKNWIEMKYYVNGELSKIETREIEYYK